MFSQPNSVNPDNKEDIEQLLANLKRIDEIFSERNDLTSITLKELIESKTLNLRSISSDNDDPDAINPIKTLCEKAIQNPDTVLTLSTFYDSILEDWFAKQAVFFMLAGTMPKDSHDVMDDMFQFAQALACEMHQREIRVITSDMTELWNKFFKDKNPNTVRGCEACPLTKVKGGYAFLTDKLIPYFVARASLQYAQAYKAQ
jgi:hypothetical protein